jgi:single-strand DNA-binding protein
VSGYQQTVIVGNLGKEPETHRTQSGKVFYTFTVAVNEKQRQASGQWADQTTWYNVVVWEDKIGGAIEYLDKGKQVMVIGRCEPNAWRDKQSGEIRSNLRLSAKQVILLGAGSGRPRDEWWAGEYGDAPAANADDHSFDVPF